MSLQFLGGASTPGGSGASANPGTVLILGASIEFNEGTDWPLAAPEAGTSQVANPAGPIRWASWLAGDTLRQVKNAAASGPTSAQQLVNVQNPASSQYALGLNPAPGFIYLGHVTGDDPGTLTPDQSATNDLAIYTLMRTQYPSAVIILPTLPGVNIPNGTGNAATRATVNPQRRLLAAQNPNTLLFDFEGIYTNPLTGLPVVAYAQDAIHPSVTGAYTVGLALSKLIAPMLPGKSLVNDYANDARVSAANGGWTTDAMMTGTPGANVTASGWSFSGPAGGTRNLVARTDQYGNWQEMIYGGTAGTLKISHLYGVTLPQNAVVQAECEVQFLGTIPAGVTDISLGLLLVNASFATIGTAFAAGTTLGNQGNYPEPGNGVVLTLRTPPLIVPSGMSTAASGVQFQMSGTATSGGIRVGRASMIRLA